MRNCKCFIKQYQHGFNDGFEYHDGKVSPLTISSWQANNFVIFYEENPKSETRRGRKMTDKSNCLMAQNDTNFMKYEGPRIINLFGKKVRVLGIRRLTPTECARLQTIPTWYKWECSDSQAYRMLGNGWTVEVIKHFFSFLPFAKEITELQSKLTLASLAEDCSSLRHKRCNYCSELQHQKYKRCLAMAEMCDARYDEEDAKVNGCGASWEYTSKGMKYWERWRWRWLEIAEQFKPNNSTDQ